MLTVLALLTAGSMSTQPVVGPRTTLERNSTVVAQEETPEAPPPTVRPALPNLKTLKQINRPPMPAGQPGSRAQPVRPVIPRGVEPAVDRNQLNPPIPSGKPLSPATRKLREDPDTEESPAAGPQQSPQSKARAESGAKQSQAGSEPGAVKEEDKKCRPLPRNVKVKMNFNEAELMEIVQWISEQTCKNFIIGEGIQRGKLTILSKTPVTANEAYQAFISALNVNNMTMVQVGSFLKIIQKREGKQDVIPMFTKPEDELPDSEQMVTRIVNPQFLDANQVSATLKALITKDGDINVYQPSNTLIISDTALNVYRLLKILKQLDSPLGQEEIRIISVEYAVAADLAKTLEELFGQKGGAAAPGAKPGTPRVRLAPSQPSQTPETEEEGVLVSKIIAEERTNQLIVVATERSFAKIEELIEKIDIPVAGEGQIQVVYLKHANAEDMASTLSSLSQGTQSRPKTAGSAKAPTGSPTRAAELFQGEVKVTAHKGNNSLVVVASQSDFRSLQKVVEKLDQPRRQVFVEAVIMEVNLDTSRDVGIALHGGAGVGMGGDTLPLLFGTQTSVGGKALNSVLLSMENLNILGFMGGLRGPTLEGSESYFGIPIPAFGVILRALQTDSSVNVLSTPHILTTDNEEAEIKVGENVPMPSGFSPMGNMSGLSGLASSLAGTTGRTGANALGGALGALGGIGGMGSMMGGYGGYGIQRQEVGLTLKAKPQINEGNFIRMELSMELSEVKSTGDPLGPTTTQRAAKTVVIVKDQQTVVVGGLMRDKVDVSETKIPLLGDIPVIGWLFRSKRQVKTKTNLLLFLTPYVVESERDFRTIFERKLRERKDFMERFYGVAPEYESFIDFGRKRGPLAEMHITLKSEMAKIENGGSGGTDEVLVTPERKPKNDEKPLPPAAEPPAAVKPPAAAEPPAAEPPAADLPAADLPAADLPAADLPAAEPTAAKAPAAEPVATKPAATEPAELAPTPPLSAPEAKEKAPPVQEDRLTVE